MPAWSAPTSTPGPRSYAAPAPAPRWSGSARAVTVISVIAALVAGAFAVISVTGGKDKQAEVAANPIPSPVASAPATESGRRPSPIAAGAAALPTLDESQEDLRTALAAETVLAIDRNSFSDDIRILAEYTAGEPFVRGQGIGAPTGRVVNVAVGEQNKLVCLTSSTEQGVAVVTMLLNERREVRFGPGPIDRCSNATATALPPA